MIERRNTNLSYIADAAEKKNHFANVVICARNGKERFIMYEGAGIISEADARTSKELLRGIYEICIGKEAYYRIYAVYSTHRGVVPTYRLKAH